MCLQAQEPITDMDWKSVVNEYNALLIDILNTKQNTLAYQRSYAYFVSYLAQLQQEYPHDEVMKFSLDNRSYKPSYYFNLGSSQHNYPLVFGLKKHLMLWLQDLF